MQESRGARDLTPGRPGRVGKIGEGQAALRGRGGDEGAVAPPEPRGAGGTAEGEAWDGRVLLLPGAGAAGHPR